MFWPLNASLRSEPVRTVTLAQKKNYLWLWPICNSYYRSGSLRDRRKCSIEFNFTVNNVLSGVCDSCDDWYCGFTNLNVTRVAISDRQNRVNRGIFGSDWNSAGRAREIWSANSGKSGRSGISADRVNRAFRGLRGVGGRGFLEDSRRFCWSKSFFCGKAPIQHLPETFSSKWPQSILHSFC